VTGVGKLYRLQEKNYSMEKYTTTIDEEQRKCIVLKLSDYFLVSTYVNMLYKLGEWYSAIKFGKQNIISLLFNIFLGVKFFFMPYKFAELNC
jgi:hypothetical protein